MKLEKESKTVKIRKGYFAGTLVFPISCNNEVCWLRQTATFIQVAISANHSYNKPFKSYIAFFFEENIWETESNTEKIE